MSPPTRRAPGRDSRGTLQNYLREENSNTSCPWCTETSDGRVALQDAALRAVGLAKVLEAGELDPTWRTAECIASLAILARRVSDDLEPLRAAAAA